jgi:hypothetical protein
VGLTAGDLRAIRRDSHPAIIVAALWPVRYQRYMLLPSPGAMEDPYQGERELLELAELVALSHFHRGLGALGSWSARACRCSI